MEGESILIEEGFTLQKYEQLFFDTMEQDELEEWTDRLPHHPKLPPKTEKKQKNCVSNSPSSLDDSDVDEEGYFVLGGGQKKGGASAQRQVPTRRRSLLPKQTRRGRIGPRAKRRMTMNLMGKTVCQVVNSVESKRNYLTLG